MESVLAAKAATGAKSSLGAKVTSTKSAGLKSGVEAKAASKSAPVAKSSVLSKAAASKVTSSDGFSQSVHSVGNVNVAKVTCQQCNIPNQSGTQPSSTLYDKLSMSDFDSGSFGTQ